MTKFSASQQNQLAQIGAFLRENRESQGKSLEDIAIRTYIRPQLLSGIETGDPDKLPEPIFVQGFIRRYAETLGLQGIEISQQFTVTSIPSTPRPAPRAEAPESSTTRMTRRVTAAPATGNEGTSGKSAGSAASGPLFNAGSLSPLGEPFPNSTTDKTPDTPVPANPTDIPLIVDDAVAGLPSNSSAEGLADSGAIAPPSLTDATVEAPVPNTLNLDLPTADTKSDFSTPTSAFDQAVLQTSGETPSPSAAPASNAQFNDELPATFTTEVTTTTPGTAARTPYSNEPIGVEIEREGPNLKPFAIGAVVLAALIAGIVLLVNALGGGDRTSIADSPEPSPEPVVEEVLPEPPAPEPAPVSDAPVYIETEATAETYVSIQADGVTVFEDIMQPGDTRLWEAQEIIDVYSGNAGGLSISANGGPSEVVGEPGQLGQKIFEAP